MYEITFYRERLDNLLEAIVIRAETEDGMLVRCKVPYALLRCILGNQQATLDELQSAARDHLDAFKAAFRIMIGQNALEKCADPGATGSYQAILTCERVPSLGLGMGSTSPGQDSCVAQPDQS